MPESLDDRLRALSADNNYLSEITIDDVVAAKGFIRMKPSSQSEYLILLASLNLLNAAIKRPEYKSVLHYGMIKGNVSRLIKYLAGHPLSRSSIKMHIDMQGHVAYLMLKGWQFSFHNIHVSDVVRQFAESSDNKPQNWQGVRLQRIAGELFRWADGYYNTMRKAKKDAVFTSLAIMGVIGSLYGINSTSRLS